MAEQSAHVPLRGRRASGRSCTIHGDNGCEIQGEAGPPDRTAEKRRWRRDEVEPATYADPRTCPWCMAPELVRPAGSTTGQQVCMACSGQADPQGRRLTHDEAWSLYGNLYLAAPRGADEG